MKDLPIQWASKGGSVVDVFGERKYGEVMEDTWGHLKPEDIEYKGWLMVYHTAYGDYGMLDWEFKSGDKELPASPWQFDDFLANIEKWIADTYPDLKDWGPGIYWFEGTYKRPFLEGEWMYHRFSDIVERRGGW